MKVYYNEIDVQKAHCLRQFISDGLIADGDVDERSIKEVRANDIRGYTQCHFFAGGGFWSYALRLAGWPDDRPVWTGSCPCPSFSAAGKGEGFEDPRHLWPDWFRLIRKCNPPTIFGEQVDRAIGYGWLDLVQSDLETKDYALGTAVLGACSVGAPQRRQRLYFVASAAETRCDDAREYGSGSSLLSARSEQCSVVSELACATEKRWERGRAGEESCESGEKQRPERLCDVSVLGAASRPGLEGRQSESGHDGPQQQTAERTGGDASGLELTQSIGRQQRRTESSRRSIESRCFTNSQPIRPGPVNGFWRDADWIRCTDGKFRAVRPGTQPLAHGSPARVLRLRMYGDGIVPQVAAAFIKAYAG